MVDGVLNEGIGRFEGRSANIAHYRFRPCWLSFAACLLVSQTSFRRMKTLSTAFRAARVRSLAVVFEHVVPEFRRFLKLRWTKMAHSHFALNLLEQSFAEFLVRFEMSQLNVSFGAPVAAEHLGIFWWRLFIFWTVLGLIFMA